MQPARLASCLSRAPPFIHTHIHTQKKIAELKEDIEKKGQDVRQGKAREENLAIELQAVSDAVVIHVVMVEHILYMQIKMYVFMCDLD